MTIDAPTVATTAENGSWLRRLCARTSGWCAWLVDAHHARIPF